MKAAVNSIWVNNNKLISTTEALSLLDPKNLDWTKIVNLLGPEIRTLADSLWTQVIDDPDWNLQAKPHADEPSVTLIDKCEIAPGIVKTLRITDIWIAPKYIEFIKWYEWVSRSELYSFYVEAGKCIYATQEWEEIGKGRKITITSELMQEIRLFLEQALNMVKKTNEGGDGEDNNAYTTIRIVGENVDQVMA